MGGWGPVGPPTGGAGPDQLKVTCLSSAPPNRGQLMAVRYVCKRGNGRGGEEGKERKGEERRGEERRGEEKGGEGRKGRREERE